MLRQEREKTGVERFLGRLSPYCIPRSGGSHAEAVEKSIPASPEKGYPGRGSRYKIFPMNHGSKWMQRLCRAVARYYLRKPDQADLLYLKHPAPRDLVTAALNEAAFRLGRARSHRLFALNVELTSRCNLACHHCPRGEDPPRREPDMDLDTFQRIVDATPRLRLLLPFQWGEPLLSPVLFDAVAYAARRGIRVMLTTNGTLLDERASQALLDSGLERLTLSFDGGLDSHRRLRGVDPGKVLENWERFKALRDLRGASCALDVSMVVDEETEPFIPEFRRLFAQRADRIPLIPRFVRKPRTRPCRELWRGVLVVLSSGLVTACCADPAGKLALGHVRTDTPAALFNGPAMQQLRRRHAALDFPDPCRCCGEYATEKASPRFS